MADFVREGGILEPSPPRGPGALLWRGGVVGGSLAPGRDDLGGMGEVLGLHDDLGRAQESLSGAELVHQLRARRAGGHSLGFQQADQQLGLDERGRRVQHSKIHSSHGTSFWFRGRHFKRVPPFGWIAT